MTAGAKVVVGLCLALFATVLAARLAFEASQAGNQPGLQAWAEDRMQFVSWNGDKWTTWIRGSKFELVPQDAGDWSRHSNSSLAFIGWDGEPWQAKIDEKGFVLALRGNWHGTTQHASAIRYRDWQGENQLRTVAQLMH
jgi:hypothetical protein